MTRVESILQELQRAYPHAKIALSYKTPWQLLVAVVLSAQCTDALVNKVTPGLFAKYSSLEDFVNADLKEFSNDIRAIGFYHAKAKNILATARILKERYHGKVPKTMEELTSLPGIGRKSANVILGNAFGVVVGIAVDTHVHRVGQRLRLVNVDAIGGKDIRTFTKDGKDIIDFKKDADPNKIEKELLAIVSKKDWYAFNYQIITHGRSVCKAIRPDCSHCVLRPFCPSSRI